MEFEKQLEEWMKLDYVLPEDLPNIELYMDQVTTFLEEQLKNTKRFEEDKIFTKTMINNYTKNHLLPPSNKKKYSRNHMILLIYIYYLKNFLSISDIFLSVFVFDFSTMSLFTKSSILSHKLLY